jgi:hypothetical protein
LTVLSRRVQDFAAGGRDGKAYIGCGGVTTACASLRGRLEIAWTIQAGGNVGSGGVTTACAGLRVQLDIAWTIQAGATNAVREMGWGGVCLKFLLIMAHTIRAGQMRRLGDGIPAASSQTVGPLVTANINAN